MQDQDGQNNNNIVSGLSYLIAPLAAYFHIKYHGKAQYDSPLVHR